MLGAMAIESDSASRQAEGACGPGAAACSAGLSPGPGAIFSVADLSGSLAGASAGRAFGNGTDRCRMARRGFGLLSPNRPLQGTRADLRATAGPQGAQTASRAAAPVTSIAAWERPARP